MARGKKHLATLVEHTERDDSGRCRFTMSWTNAHGEPRWQVFFANPAAHADQLRGRGWRVAFAREEVVR